jgi:hypothetical protein
LASPWLSSSAPRLHAVRSLAHSAAAAAAAASCSSSSCPPPPSPDHGPAKVEPTAVSITGRFRSAKRRWNSVTESAPAGMRGTPTQRCVRTAALACDQALLTRRARAASGTATQSTRGKDSPATPPPLTGATAAVALGRLVTRTAAAANSADTAGAAVRVNRRRRRRRRRVPVHVHAGATVVVGGRRRPF